MVKLYNVLGEGTHTFPSSTVLHLGERTRIYQVPHPWIRGDSLVLKLFANMNDYKKEHGILTALRCELSKTPKDAYLFSLGHPMFYDIVRAETNGESFDCIVFSYYETTLQRFLLQRAKTSHTTLMLWIYKELQKCLKVMQRLRLVHGDLKPDNLFVVIQENPTTKKPRLKRLVLNDFEFAQFLPIGTTVVRLAQPVGTPVYMSPDMIRERRMDLKTDAWSVACMLMNALTLYNTTDGKSAFLHLYGSPFVSSLHLLNAIPTLPDTLCQWIQSHLLSNDSSALKSLIADIDKTLLGKTTGSAAECTDWKMCFIEDPSATPYSFQRWVFLNPQSPPVGYEVILAFIFQTILSFATTDTCRSLLEIETSYADDFEPDEQTGGRRQFHGLRRLRGLRGLRQLREKHSAYMQRYKKDQYTNT